MRCPYCRSDKISVTDKRDSGDNTVRRRRECEECKKRFTTYEKIEVAPLVVIKRDGRREAFDRDKVRNGIMKACEKRPISQDKIERLVDEVEAEIRSSEKVEMKSKSIGEIVMNKLRDLDEVAYIRFASVYRQFKDVEDFKKQLHELRKK